MFTKSVSADRGLVGQPRMFGARGDWTSRRTLGGLASAENNSATRWLFAERGLAGTPWEALSRTGLGTRLGSTGLVEYGPHNLTACFANPATTAAVTSSSASCVVSLADMPAELSAAGLSDVCTSGRVYKCDNTANPAMGFVYFAGPPGSTTLNNYSCYMMGTGWLSDAWSGSPHAAIPSSLAFTRISADVTPTSSANSFLAARIPPGHIVYMILPQITEGSGVKSLALNPSTAARYLPRITHDPVTAQRLGLLVEGQATDVAQCDLNAVAATQTRTVTASVWTVSFTGTGSLALSGAHTATITGIGANRAVSLTFTPSAGSLVMTVSGDVRNLDMVNQECASSSIPNAGTGSAVRVADSSGPGLALTGSALSAAFPGGVTQPFTGVIRYRKRYGVASNETLCALSAGSSAGGTNLLAVRTNGTQAQLVHSGGAGSLTGTLVHDGNTVNRVAYSVDPAAGKMSISVNGGAAVETTGISYTGAGVAALIAGSQTYSGTEPMGSMVIESWDHTRSTYITGAALAALSA